LATASYPLLWASCDFTDPVVAALGLAFPNGIRIVPFLALTSVNLIGMIMLWLACMDILGSYRTTARSTATRYNRASPAEATTFHPAAAPGSRPPSPRS
jgi:hypothetical protein